MKRMINYQTNLYERYLTMIQECTIIRMSKSTIVNNISLFFIQKRNQDL
jgi:hypothetical protein